MNSRSPTKALMMNFPQDPKPNNHQNLNFRKTEAPPIMMPTPKIMALNNDQRILGIIHSSKSFFQSAAIV